MADGKQLSLGITVNVAQFGAKGDGVTIDNNAFDSAITTLSTSGGTIYVPRGDYKLTKSFIIPDGVSIRGDGSLASRLLNSGTTDCLVYGTGVTGADPDIERTTVEQLAIIGTATSGKAFWGRKATTMFCIRDVYIEGGNSPVVLDSCYSLMMERVQVRSAETGHNISLNSISHDVTLLQVSSQVAKAGAGLYMTGCYTPRMWGGKLEFNKNDQMLIGTGCRGVSVRDLYIEGIQPTSTGYAGIQVQDADTVLIQGGFFDATQNGINGTNGTGTYLKVSGAASRVRLLDYGFPSVASTQTHVNFGMTADNCEAYVPAMAVYVNGNPARNIVRPNCADDEPVIAVNSAGFALTHNARNALTFVTEIRDPLGQWNGTTFTPRYTGFHGVKGFVKITGLAANSQVSMVLRDTQTSVDLASVAYYFGVGSPSVLFDFAEVLEAGHTYQVQLFLLDGSGTNRATTAVESENRIAIERKF